MHNNIQPVLHDGLVDFRRIFQVIFRARYLVIGLTAVFAAGSLIYSMTLPNVYTSTVILSPVNQEDGGLPSSLSRVGNLASIAGVNFGSKGDPESKVAQEIVRSWGFMEDFIEKYNLQVELFAAIGWNESENSLIIDDEVYDKENKKWLLKDDRGEPVEPSSWKLYKILSNMLDINEDSDEELVSLSISHYSPYLAKQWVDLIFQEINMHMQQRKLRKVNNNIEYLKVQIEKTSVFNMENVFYVIIEEQMKSKMIAEASPEHTYTVVSRSMVPEKEAGPTREIYVVLGGMFGLVFSVSLVLFNYSMSTARKKLPN